jgi:threonyl-tRNA synthetase
MSNINITLPDGSVKSMPAGSTSYDVALSISEGLARNVISAKVNGEVWDLSREISEDATVQLLTWRDEDGKQHSGIHRPT